MTWEAWVPHIAADRLRTRCHGGNGIVARVQQKSGPHCRVVLVCSALCQLQVERPQAGCLRLAAQTMGLLSCLELLCARPAIWASTCEARNVSKSIDTSAAYEVHSYRT